MNEKENREFEQTTQSKLSEVYKILGAHSPLEMSQLYSVEDQRLMNPFTWDYDNPDLVINRIKVLLENLDPAQLTDEEFKWRQEVLWKWYHHAISCAITKADKAAALNYSQIALDLQEGNHPNQITRMLYYLVRDDFEKAAEHASQITEEPEKTTAQELLQDFKDNDFFKK